MPRFFLDCYEGGQLLVDDQTGTCHDGIGSAQGEATRALSRLARDVVDGRDRSIALVVRDEAGRGLYEATLTVEGRLL